MVDVPVSDIVFSKKRFEGVGRTTKKSKREACSFALGGKKKEAPGRRQGPQRVLDRVVLEGRRVVLRAEGEVGRGPARQQREPLRAELLGTFFFATLVSKEGD